MLILTLPRLQLVVILLFSPLKIDASRHPPTAEYYANELERSTNREREATYRKWSKDFEEHKEQMRVQGPFATVDEAHQASVRYDLANEMSGLMKDLTKERRKFALDAYKKNKDKYKK